MLAFLLIPREASPSLLVGSRRFWSAWLPTNQGTLRALDMHLAWIVRLEIADIEGNPSSPAQEDVRCGIRFAPVSHPTPISAQQTLIVFTSGDALTYGSQR